MTLLLDIDGVLLDWSGKADRSKTGFNDFVRPQVRFFNWYSPFQLNLIASSFPKILWHTTWVAGQMTDSLFTPQTGFGPYSSLVSSLKHNDEGSFWVTPPDGVQVAAHFDDPDLVRLLQGENWFEGEWWKLNAVAAALEADLLPGRVVWVDDDILGFKKQVFGVLDHFDAVDRFKLYSPSQVWTKSDVLEAAEWVQG